MLSHTPDPKFSYPQTFMHGCNRRIKPEWIHSRPWLHYSVSEDGVYCKACALFSQSAVKKQKLGSLVSKPFSVWTKQCSVFKSHELTDYHQSSITRMTMFKESSLHPTHNVATMLSATHRDQVSRNTEVIKSLLKCVAFCGKQGISLRGHRDDSTASQSSNTGNFLGLVQFRAENDDVLRTYLETAPKNALYTSKTIQNEMISVLGDEVENKIILRYSEDRKI